MVARGEALRARLAFRRPSEPPEPDDGGVLLPLGHAVPPALHHAENALGEGVLAVLLPAVAPAGHLVRPEDLGIGGVVVVERERDGVVAIHDAHPEDAPTRITSDRLDDSLPDALLDAFRSPPPLVTLPRRFVNQILRSAPARPPPGRAPSSSRSCRSCAS